MMAIFLEIPYGMYSVNNRAVGTEEREVEGENLIVVYHIVFVNRSYLVPKPNEHSGNMTSARLRYRAEEFLDDTR